MYFVKFIEHSQEFYELIMQRPSAFVLLAIIADRALKAPLVIPNGRDVGEAFIGDYEKYGATQQSYRTDKKILEKFGLVTFRPTSKGTIAKIVNSSIFDISRETSTSQSTIKQRANNMPATTKQEVRTERKQLGASNAMLMGKKNFSHGASTDSPLLVSSHLSNESNETAHSYYKNNHKVHEFIVSEDYWDERAPLIARRMGIDIYSDRYVDARADWLMKADTASPNSIRSFLKQASDGNQYEKY